MTAIGILAIILGIIIPLLLGVAFLVLDSTTSASTLPGQIQFGGEENENGNV